MSSRIVGAMVAGSLGLAAAALPLGYLWVGPSDLPIPLWLAAAFGATVTGGWLAPRLAPVSAYRPGWVAATFVIGAAVAAAPILVLDGLILGMEPFEEPWPVQPGPLFLAVLGVYMWAPFVVLVALPESLIWAVVVRFILERLPLQTEHRARPDQPLS
jgi:hypothetical protein